MSLKLKTNNRQKKSTQKISKQNGPGIGMIKESALMKHSSYPGITPTNKQNVQKNYKIVMLHYDLSTSEFKNAGGPIIQETYKLNSLYDFITTLFTQVWQLLNYNFGIYTLAKVICLMFKIIFCNLETVPCDLYWFETAQNPASSFGTRAAIEAMAGTTNVKWTDTVTPYGLGDIKYFERVVYPASVFGNPDSYYGSDDYAFTATSDPAKLVYGGFVGVTPESTLLSGITAKLTVSARVKFYLPNNLSSPLLNIIPDVIHLSRVKITDIIQDLLTAMVDMRARMKVHYEEWCEEEARRRLWLRKRLPVVDQSTSVDAVSLPIAEQSPIKPPSSVYVDCGGNKFVLMTPVVT